jgi:hypothetical protein
LYNLQEACGVVKEFKWVSRSRHINELTTGFGHGVGGSTKCGCLRMDVAQFNPCIQGVSAFVYPYVADVHLYFYNDD